jgi:hypothetical protein
MLDKIYEQIQETVQLENEIKNLKEILNKWKFIFIYI